MDHSSEARVPTVRRLDAANFRRLCCVTRLKIVDVGMGTGMPGFNDEIVSRLTQAGDLRPAEDAWDNDEPVAIVALDVGST